LGEEEAMTQKCPHCGSKIAHTPAEDLLEHVSRSARNARKAFEQRQEFYAEAMEKGDRINQGRKAHVVESFRRRAEKWEAWQEWVESVLAKDGAG
jgi:hypothetical protein